MNLKVFCLVLASLIFTTALEAQEKKTLVLKDGRRVTGIVTKIPGGYQVEGRIAVTTHLDDEVASIEDAALTPEEEYAQKLEKLDTASADAQYELAEWAYKNNLREHARRHLREALRIDPDHIKAKALLAQVEAQRPQGQDGTQGTAADADFRQEWLIDQQDIERVRLEELRPGDKVTVRLQNNVINRFVEMMDGTDEFKKPRAAEQFRGLPPIRQVHYMLDKLDSDNTSIKDDIVVTSDPKFMIDFRQRIWPLVASTCGASACHGGSEVRGGLRLFVSGVSSERIDYTNFVILDGFVSQGRRMIDRANPEMSLLVSYALPEGQGKFRHPVKINPAFSRTSPSYHMLLSWIKDLRTIHPDYRLQYKPPFGMKIQWRSEGLLPPVSAPATGEGALP
ncbi:MAG: hypothetical protein GXY38_09910 [Planctomycetes bacterium]|jgi:hypothetical protein|nr:hypothetical protein [Planctomycetota bacterium]